MRDEAKCPEKVRASSPKASDEVSVCSRGIRLTTGLKVGLQSRIAPSPSELGPGDEDAR
jgi:hypothetical protein